MRRVSISEPLMWTGGKEMYLHRDRETFKDIIGQASDSSGRTPAVVEKDYYVTLILKLLSEQLDQCVFKGGTSL